jgi:protease-4
MKVVPVKMPVKMILAGVVGALIALAVLGKGDFSQGLASSTSGNRVAVVHLDGPIMAAEATVLWLRRLTTEIEGVKAVVLAVNSPGGGVAASQEIYSAVRRLREREIKVVVAMGSMAASGAYYVACAADNIVCQPGTMTGSIGVIAEFAQASELLDKVGLKFQVVKSGRFKDTGNPARPMREDEKILLQGMIDDVYAQFVDAIVEERRGPLRTALARQRKLADESQLDGPAVEAYVRSFADGRLLSGRQALQLGLVDQLGDMEDAVARAAKLAGIEDPDVVTRRVRRHWSDYLAGAASAAGRAAMESVKNGLESASRRDPVSLKAY